MSRIFTSPRFSALVAATLFGRLHYYLIALVISNYLAQFMGDIALGWVIAGASVVVAASLSFFPAIFTRFGTSRVLVALTVGEAAAVVGLFASESAAVAAFFFAVQGIFAYNIFLGIDLLLESQSADEETGRLRGMFLVVSNTAVLAASLALSGILYDGNFGSVFLVALALLVPFLALVAFFLPPISNPIATLRESFSQSLGGIVHRPSLLPVLAGHFLVLLFFTWEIYYIPLYLREHIGFSWQIISALFAISVLPYIFFEYTLGKIADTYLGEKEMTIAGFVIVSVGVAAFSFAEFVPVMLWAALIFIANIGGAAVEVMTETHFFKRVSAMDANLIGIYQMLRPISAVVGPIVASLALLLVPFPFIFAVFGAILALGIPITFLMKDTR
ncbi:MAG TPA: MFS transporter [Candidatus Paceibacterota bacterium]